MTPIIRSIIIGAAITLAGFIFVIINISRVFNNDGANFLGESFFKKHIIGIALLGIGGLVMITSAIIAAINALNNLS